MFNRCLHGRYNYQKIEIKFNIVKPKNFVFCFLDCGKPLEAFEQEKAKLMYKVLKDKW